MTRACPPAPEGAGLRAEYEQEEKLLYLLIGAIDRRETLEWRFTSETLVSAKDLAEIERYFDRLLKLILRKIYKTRVPRGWRLQLPINECQHIEDGENDLIVKLDFERIFGKKAEATPARRRP